MEVGKLISRLSRLQRGVVQLRNSIQKLDRPNIYCDLVVIRMVAAIKSDSRPPRKRHAYLCPIQTTPRVNPGRTERADWWLLGRFRALTRKFQGISGGIFPSKEARRLGRASRHCWNVGKIIARKASQIGGNPTQGLGLHLRPDRRNHAPCPTARKRSPSARCARWACVGCLSIAPTTPAAIQSR